MNIQELIELYNNGKSLSELSRLYSYSAGTIKTILINNNVKIRSRHEQNIITNTNRKKKVNDEYFLNIDTLNKAWLLGFLAADGYIYKNRNCIRINLSQVDKEILEKIKIELGIEKDIVDTINSHGYYVSYLSWSSEQQKKDLAKFGVVPLKTYLPVHLPKFNNDDYVMAYILGYFDGDGSFNSNGRNCRFRICSHRKEILNDISNYLSKKYNLNFSLSQDNRDLYELSISTKGAIKILTDMYNLNSLKLDRKYQKFLEYKTTRL